RTQGYLAFPWGTLGYAWLDTPVAQLASVGGVYLLSLLVTVPGALLALPLVTPRTSLGPPTARLLLAPAAALLGVAAAWYVGSGLEASAQEALRPTTRLARLVRGNVDAFGRASGAARDLETHLDLTRQAVAEARAAGAPPFDLLVWPEGAGSGYVLDGPPGAALPAAVGALRPDTAAVRGA